MTGRKRTYYSAEQIEKNLYTYGKQWMTLDDWKEYIGFYHKYSTGEVFSETNWMPGTSMKLVPYRNRSDDYFKYVDLVEYTTIGKNKLKIVGSDVTEMGNFRTPLPNKKQPTPSDIKRGQMHRFFIYKRNEPNRVFYEIDQDQVSTYKMKRDGINQVLYGLEEISWKLTGPEYDEYYNGILMAPGVVDTNSRIMLKMSNKFSIFTNIVNNPREYTVYDENFQ
jgi:hypothetical protein